VIPVPEPASPNGHVVAPVQDATPLMVERYAAGATLDELAVEFHMPPTRCRHVLLQAGVFLRPVTAPAPGAWFDAAAIPLDRQREIAEAYRAFPGHEVAAAYGIPLRWVRKIAHLHGVRKAAPRGYRKRRAGPTPVHHAAARVPIQGYRATLLVEARVDARSWDAAVAQLRQRGAPVQVLRICAIQSLVALDSEPREF